MLSNIYVEHRHTHTHTALHTHTHTTHTAITQLSHTRTNHTACTPTPSPHTPPHTHRHTTPHTQGRSLMVSSVCYSLHALMCVCVCATSGLPSLLACSKVGGADHVRMRNNTWLEIKAFVVFWICSSAWSILFDRGSVIWLRRSRHWWNTMVEGCWWEAMGAIEWQLISHTSVHCHVLDFTTIS